MRRTAWGRVAGVVVAVVLVAGACGGDDDGGDASPEGGSQPAVTTTAPAPSTTPAPETTTTTADPLAVPAVIDAAYLDRVLAEIEHVVGDAGRMIQAAGAVTPEAEALLATVYSPEFLEIQIQGWEQVLADPAEVAALRQPIGDRVTTIAELFTATPECVFARVEQDFSPITSDPPDQGERYLLLFPVDATQDPSGTNPTSWRIQDRGVAPAGVEPGDPCVG